MAIVVQHGDPFATMAGAFGAGSAAAARADQANRMRWAELSQRRDQFDRQLEQRDQQFADLFEQRDRFNQASREDAAEGRRIQQQQFESLFNQRNDLAEMSRIADEENQERQHQGRIALLEAGFQIDQRRAQQQLNQQMLLNSLQPNINQQARRRQLEAALTNIEASIAASDTPNPQLQRQLEAVRAGLLPLQRQEATANVVREELEATRARNELSQRLIPQDLGNGVIGTFIPDSSDPSGYRLLHTAQPQATQRQQMLLNGMINYARAMQTINPTTGATVPADMSRFWDMYNEVERRTQTTQPSDLAPAGAPAGWLVPATSQESDRISEQMETVRGQLGLTQPADNQAQRDWLMRAQRYRADPDNNPAPGPMPVTGGWDIDMTPIGSGERSAGNILGRSMSEAGGYIGDIFRGDINNPRTYGTQNNMPPRTFRATQLGGGQDRYALLEFVDGRWQQRGVAQSAAAALAWRNREGESNVANELQLDNNEPQTAPPPSVGIRPVGPTGRRPRQNTGGASIFRRGRPSRGRIPGE